jgi:hypothetical protein
MINAPFQRLPTETLLTIMKLVPDLSSLCQFMQASAAVTKVFKGYPREITEAILG